jgi:hypothetical protein
MYLDNEDTRYWESEAEDARGWMRVVYAIRRDIRRRMPGYSAEKYDLLNEADRAYALFYAQYHYANAHAELGHYGLSLSDMFAA